MFSPDRPRGNRPALARTGAFLQYQGHVCTPPIATLRDIPGVSTTRGSDPAPTSGLEPPIKAAEGVTNPPDIDDLELELTRSC